jgi:PadR family transcriptional regulator PadR
MANGRFRETFKMYPTLHALRKKGYLSEERRVVGGKVRKYYRITETGRQVLALVRPKIRELVGEVLDERQVPDELIL